MHTTTGIAFLSLSWLLAKRDNIDQFKAIASITNQQLLLFFFQSSLYFKYIYTNLFYPNTILITNALHFKIFAPSHFLRMKKWFSNWIFPVWKGTEIRWQQGVNNLEVIFSAHSLKIKALLFRSHTIVPLLVKRMPRDECTVLN